VDRGRGQRAHPGTAEGEPAQQGAVAVAGRRGLPGAVPRGGPRRAGAVHLRRRGLDPQREDQRGRVLDVVRQRPGHRRAAHAELVDRPARAAGLGGRRGRDVRDVRRHPRDGGQPDRVHGPRRLPRRGLPVGGRSADRQRAGLPRPAGELHGDAHMGALPRGGLGAPAAARRPAPPPVDLREDRPRGLRPRRLLRAGRLRRRLQLPEVPGEDRLLGAGGELQRPQARLDGRHRRLPERRRHLHRLHHAGLPRQVHAVHGRPARQQPVVDAHQALRRLHPPDARHHQRDREPGTQVAPQPRGADQRLRPALAALAERGLIMAKTAPRPAGTEPGQLVEMSWDPITRIIGNLGIYTKIDFANRRVAECHSTSSLFRGYSVFMKGKDPRDAGFITSRICGICGDNHTTCSVYAQNMAYGIKNPPLAGWLLNRGEAAEYMVERTLFQDNLVFVEFCEAMVEETNPGVLRRARTTDAPHAAVHGFRTIAEIMEAFNPFEGEVYKEALKISRTTREMFCLMEGRHVHPSTVYPGGVGTMPTPSVFTDYLSRLIGIVDFVKKAVAMNDDVFDFFYEALPGYEEVGRRRVMLGCWGAF